MRDGLLNWNLCARSGAGPRMRSDSKKTSVPVVFDATRLHLISAAGNCWFYVPEEPTISVVASLVKRTKWCVRPSSTAADEKEAEADNIAAVQNSYIPY